MKKMFSMLFLFSLVFSSGCMIFTSDPAAERAFDTYHRLHIRLPEGAVTLESALAQSDPADHLAIRIAFAHIHTLKDVRTPEAVLAVEKARIELNTLLGYLPSDTITYSAGTALDCPEELPPVSTADKAALINDNGATPPLLLLRAVRIAHAEAAAAMNEKLLAPASPEKVLAYRIACIRLAHLIGVAPAELNTLGEFEQRFDAAEARWQKSSLF